MFTRKEDQITQRKYGKAIWLPRGDAIRLSKGDGFADFFSSAAKFIGDNKDAVSTGVNAIQAVAKQESILLRERKKWKILRHCEIRRRSAKQQNL